MMSEERTPIEAKIWHKLEQIIDPDLNRDIVSLGFVKDLILKKTLSGKIDVSFKIELTTPACPVKDQFKRDAENLVGSIENVRKVYVEMTAKVRKQADGSGTQIAGVRNVIAVGSGKGGVGKSTIAVNLAYALKKLGSNVGILDADIHGPSLGLMLGLKGMPKVKNSHILPQVAHGVPAMSFAFFAPIGEAVIWRGAMTGKAVEQMLFDVNWYGENDPLPENELDYLIIDMPPGTGDIPLTLIHKVDLAGAVVVSTPQKVARIDAEKGVAMFQKMNIPVLGLIENMSGLFCQHCGKENDFFGGDTVQKQAEKQAVPFLGKIPMAPQLAISGDSGVPELVRDPDSPSSKIFITVAQELARQVSIAQAKKQEKAGTGGSIDSLDK